MAKLKSKFDMATHGLIENVEGRAKNNLVNMVFDTNVSDTYESKSTYVDVDVTRITPRSINQYSQGRIDRLARSIHNTNDRLIHPIVVVRACDLPDLAHYPAEERLPRSLRPGQSCYLHRNRRRPRDDPRGTEVLQQGAERRKAVDAAVPVESGILHVQRELPHLLGNLVQPHGESPFAVERPFVPDALPAAVRPDPYGRMPGEFVQRIPDERRHRPPGHGGRRHRHRRQEKASPKPVHSTVTVGPAVTHPVTSGSYMSSTERAGTV